MNIGIDITSVINQNAGIARYTKQLVENLLQIDKENRYLLYSFFGSNQQLVLNSQLPISETNLKLYNYPAQALKAFFFLLKTFNKTPDFLTKDADIMHSTDFVFPVSKKIPSVLTIHDLIFLRFPEFYTWKNRAYMKSLAKFSAQNAKAIIACSYSTKEDIVEFLNVSEEKITVIHEGVDEQFKPLPDKQTQSVRKKYNLPNRFLLFVGTIEPRKNLSRLLEALAMIKNKGHEHNLVIVGKKGWLYEEFFEKIKKLKLENEIIHLDNITSAELPAIYNAAEIFVYPSLYEGFGLPPLEAMACGTPVICSNTSSMPEVVSDAAIAINPKELEDILQAIEKILTNKDFAKILSAKGIEQAKKFNWKDTAKKTLEVYELIRG